MLEGNPSLFPERAPPHPRWAKGGMEGWPLRGGLQAVVQNGLRGEGDEEEVGGGHVRGGPEREEPERTRPGRTRGERATCFLYNSDIT